MTDEEMAEEWLDERYLKDMGVRKPCKEAFLAGLKAGKDMTETDVATIAYMQSAERYKTNWHRVADGDYPPYEKCDYSINVLTDRGYIAYYNYDEECWVAVPSGVEIDTPVAWCEIPKFEE